MDDQGKDRGFVISDVDGTLTSVLSVWEYLHRRLDRWDGDGDRNLADYLDGRIDYPEFARRDALAYQNLSRSRLQQLTMEIPRRRGLDTMLKYFQRLNWPVALVSSGLDILVDQIPGASIRVANRLCFLNDICTGEVVIDVPMDGKARIVASLLNSYRLDRRCVIAIGDSRGDIPMMAAAGFSIAVAPLHAEVADAADAVITGEDLSEICDLVGDYRKKAGLV